MRFVTQPRRVRFRCAVVQPVRGLVRELSKALPPSPCAAGSATRIAIGHGPPPARLRFTGPRLPLCLAALVLYWVLCVTHLGDCVCDASGQDMTAWRCVIASHHGVYQFFPHTFTRDVQAMICLGFFFRVSLFTSTDVRPFPFWTRFSLSLLVL